MTESPKPKPRPNPFAGFDPNRVPTPAELAQQAERRKAFDDLRAFEDQIGFNSADDHEFVDVNKAAREVRKREVADSLRRMNEASHQEEMKLTDETDV